jgi:Rod binding domain-containing protein
MSTPIYFTPPETLPTAVKPFSPEQLKQAAIQFEALLLRQLTASINISEGDDEDKLFGGDSGTGLAKQLFSEQMAEAMSRAGGVGLAAMLLRQTQAHKAEGAHAIQARPNAKAGLKINTVLAESPVIREQPAATPPMPVRPRRVTPLEPRPAPAGSPGAVPVILPEAVKPAQVVPAKGQAPPTGYTSIVPFGMPASETAAPREILRVQFAPPIPAAKDSPPRRR